MAPPLARAAFTAGLTVFLLALLILPSLERDSPEFVADVLALLISGVFLALIIMSVRRASRLPGVGAAKDEPRDQTEDAEVPHRRHDGP